MTDVKSVQPYLNYFNQGLVVDLCIDLSNQFGQLFQSKPTRHAIDRRHLRMLKARGFIESQLVVCFGVEYKRYVISALGRKFAKECQYASSK
jgi:hypothetical protein